MRKKTGRGDQRLSPYYYQFRFIIQATRQTSSPYYAKYHHLDGFWEPGDFWEFHDYIEHKLGARPIGHNLGRINKQKGWFPGNLHWEEPKKRSRNNHKQNVKVKYQGRTQTLVDWAEQLGIPYHTFRRRVAEGYKIRDIVKVYCGT